MRKISNSEYIKEEKQFDLYPHSITKPYISSSVSLYTPNKPLSPVILDRKYSQQETPLHINNTPPPFPKLKHNQPIQSTNGDFSNKITHDFELFIFSSVNSCEICHTKFKSTSKYIGLKCKNCHLNCHEQCSSESSYNDCKPIKNIQKNIWESLYPKTNMTESIIDHTAMSRNFSHEVLPAMCQLDTSIYSTHTTSSCSTTPSSQYSHQHISNLNKNQNPVLNYGRFDSDIGSVSGKNFKN